MVIGEKASRYAVLGMMILPYFLTVYLIATRFFTPIMAVVFLAVPSFLKIYPIFLKPKPQTAPEGQPGWPLYFVGYAFYNNRTFGMLFMIGLLLDILLRVLPLTQNFWR